ncbi:histidine phosphatase family protein [Bifidobacterium sp. ESL0732]|uniref:histidine phosphatase family protein n=1 Tax=Bifidobacterium sp. ESL0732 TaxID=2983222 RepID=UPI0023F6FF4B|nr:histidine phosphatase family protein [Bifidobacterium sp. ESL0732]WEV64168.1 phosphoglycerate mutase family protein [Bifidobacterium sp. ESL0732]
MKKSFIAKAIAMVSGVALLAGLAACGNDSSAKTAEAPKADGTVTIYLARHGQTASNVMHRSQGWSDWTLTQQGIDGAKYLGLGLKGTKFKAAYSGDLTRQEKTAEGALKYSGNKSIQLKQDWRLRECNFGSYEGRQDAAQNDVDIAAFYGYKDHDDLVAKNGLNAAVVQQNGYYQLDKANKLGTDLPAELRAESAEAIEKRMTDVLTSIGKKEMKNGGGNVLVVSSGSAINFFLLAQKFPEYTGAGMGNDAVTKLTYKNGKFALAGPIGSMDYFNAGKAKAE